MGLPEKLLLASASPRRRELLERLGLRFEVRPVDVVEDNHPAHGPARMVETNAAMKAAALSPRVPEALVLGSDTTVALEDTVLNKPVDLGEARAIGGDFLFPERRAAQYGYCTPGMLVSARALLDRNPRPTRDEVIEAYFKRVDPLDKAGAYGIQQAREMIIDSVEGSVENVMGLPIQALERRLAELKFDFRV